MIKIKGLDTVIKQLKALGKEGLQRISETTEANAAELEFKAKRNSERAFNFGDLKSNILAVEVDKLKYKVTTNAFGNAPYSAYVEFGTGGLVKVPTEMKDVAIQFLGQGIKEVNLPARPYLYPALLEQRKQYLKDLKQDLKDLTK